MNDRIRRGEEEGVTLVELIIYSMLGVVFLGIIATLFALSMNASNDARDRDQATGQARVAAESLQNSIRNSAVVRVDGNLLRAQTATAASGWECRGWALEAGEIRYTTSAFAIPTGSTAGWTALATGVVGTKTSGSPFELLSADTVDIGYTVTVGDVIVKITSAVTTQAKAEGTPTPCW